jgi:hypothetical protein
MEHCDYSTQADERRADGECDEMSVGRRVTQDSGRVQEASVPAYTKTPNRQFKEHLHQVNL